MAKITFSDENQAGDIPTYNIEKKDIFSDYRQPFNDLLDTRNGKVIVAFQTWENVKYENEHQSFCISNDDDTILEYFKNYCEFISCEQIRFNFFCFDTYEDAFKYCIDLKEGL